MGACEGAAGALGRAAGTCATDADADTDGAGPASAVGSCNALEAHDAIFANTMMTTTVTTAAIAPKMPSSVPHPRPPVWIGMKRTCMLPHFGHRSCRAPAGTPHRFPHAWHSYVSVAFAMFPMAPEASIHRLGCRPTLGYAVDTCLPRVHDASPEVTNMVAKKKAAKKPLKNDETKRTVKTPKTAAPRTAKKPAARKTPAKKTAKKG